MRNPNATVRNELGTMKTCAAEIIKLRKNLIEKEFN